ncbi:hypothetical protein AWC01_18760 [Mycobacterium doricum]|uniref:Uncharacterized protein n=1 Tax=Mycolicibacterium doricum TaxID=126673 RepID=A0A1X1SXC8_9MYCO|nr:hypothetical protein AWC01_18760 [Mycolicibacterium doricum]
MYQHFADRDDPIATAFTAASLRPPAVSPAMPRTRILHTVASVTLRTRSASEPLVTAIGQQLNLAVARADIPTASSCACRLDVVGDCWSG